MLVIFVLPIMESKIQISLVSYTNTLPFLRAFQKEGSHHKFELIPAIPSECVELFKNDVSQVSLLPIGALGDLEDFEVISQYGIACDGAVRTVKLLSNVPIEEVKHIDFDFHSRTSVQLASILLQEYWKINPQCQHNKDVCNTQADAILAIGDKVIDLESKYKYGYDLGEIWKHHTGLPFVFAAWVSKSNIATSVGNELNRIFRDLEQDLEIIRSEELTLKPWTDKYFTEFIQYKLTEQHLKGMDLFLSKLKKREVEVG